MLHPDRVLLEALQELSTCLPVSRPGASSSSGGGCEAVADLPCLFVPYHMMLLEKKLANHAAGGAKRNEREARTLCEILDALLAGRTLGAIMLALARLKAVEASVDPQGGGWSHASQHELAARPGQGLVNSRDRTLANRDQRDELRSFAPRGLPPKGKSKGQRRRGEQGET